jgi:pilus assembly protein CpaB
MKPKTLVLMLIAVSCGLVASFMTSRYLSAGQQAPKEDNKVRVLVAKKKISGYTRLTDAEIFEERLFDQNVVPKDAVSDFEAVKGRVLKVGLGEGKMLAESDLVDPTQSSPTWKLNPGELAMSVKVNADTAGAGFLMPGDRVDVQATIVRTSSPNEKPFSKFILQNIEVLAVGQDVQQPDGTIYKEPNRVLLRVTHKQAEELALYQDTGNLRLLPRRHDDPTHVDTSGTRLGANNLTSDERTGAADNLATSVLPTAPTIPAGVNEIPGEPAAPPEKKTLTIIIGDKVTTHDWKTSEVKSNEKAEEKKSDEKKP